MYRVFRNPKLRLWLKRVLILIVAATVLTALEAALDYTLPSYQILHLYDYLLHLVAVIVVLIISSILTAGRVQRWAKRLLALGLGTAFFGVFESLWDPVLLPLYGVLRLYQCGVHIAVATTMLVMLFVVTRHRFWQFYWPNRVTLWLIQRYLEWSPGGSIYYQVRKLFYAMWREEKISKRYEMVLLTLIEQEANELEEDVELLEINSRNERQESGAQKTSFDFHRVLELVKMLDLHRQALANHYCPEYRQDYEDSEKWLDAARLWDTSWLATKRLNRLTSSTELERYLEAKNRRACTLYKGFSNGPNLPDLERRFVDFRLTALEQSAGVSNDALGKIATKVEAFLFGDYSVLRSTGAQAQSKTQERAQELIKFGFLTWIEILVSNSDYQAIIQTCDRLTKLSSGLEMSLSTDMYKHLGYAWWDYAQALGNTDYGLLAWQNTLQSFMMAHFQVPLEHLRTPFFTERG